jgi:predicted phage terminase large subunit-like protein
MAKFQKKRNVLDGDLPKHVFLEQVQREIQRRRMESTASYAEWLPTASPEFNWTYPHVRYIVEKLDRFARGEIKRLMIFLPPQHGKSSAVTVRYPAYLLEKNPKTRIVVTGYGADLAETFSKQIRNLVRARNIVELDPDTQSIPKWMTRQGGGLKAVGVEGAITGFSADFIIIDDPVKNREAANSKAARDAAWRWFTDDLYTRQQADTPIVIIQTRWHEDDLSGRLLDDNEFITNPEYKWQVVSLPAICEGTDPDDYYGVIEEDGEIRKREDGEALCPELHPITQLREIERTMGSSFAALYQQRPAPAEGDIWKKAWFCEDGDDNKPYRTVNRFPNNRKITQIWDTSLEIKQRNDPCAMVEGCLGEDGFYYIAAMVNEKMEFPALVNRMRTESERIGDNVEICVEDKANAKPARQQLRLLGIPIIEVPSGTNDKEVRAKSVSHYAESGNIRFVNQIGNINHLLMDQLLIFPNGRHDDLHDSFVHLLRRLGKRNQGWNRETLKELASSIR